MDNKVNDMHVNDLVRDMDDNLMEKYLVVFDLKSKTKDEILKSPSPKTLLLRTWIEENGGKVTFRDLHKKAQHHVEDDQFAHAILIYKRKGMFAGCSTSGSRYTVVSVSD